VYDLNLLSDYDVSKDWKERKDGWKSSFSIDDEERYMVHFETICQIPNAFPTFVGMCYNDDFVTAIDELGRELIDVAFNAAGLGKKEVADHGDMVRHLDQP